MSFTSVKPLLKYSNLSFFNMAAICHIRIVGHILKPPTKRVFSGLYQCALFGWNHINR